MKNLLLITISLLLCSFNVYQADKHLMFIPSEIIYADGFTQTANHEIYILDNNKMTVFNRYKDTVEEYEFQNVYEETQRYKKSMTAYKIDKGVIEIHKQNDKIYSITIYYKGSYIKYIQYKTR